MLVGVLVGGDVLVRVGGIGVLVGVFVSLGVLVIVGVLVGGPGVKVLVGVGGIGVLDGVRVMVGVGVMVGVLVGGTGVLVGVGVGGCSGRVMHWLTEQVSPASGTSKSSWTQVWPIHDSPLSSWASQFSGPTSHDSVMTSAQAPPHSAFPAGTRHGRSQPHPLMYGRG